MRATQQALSKELIISYIVLSSLATGASSLFFQPETLISTTIRPVSLLAIVHRRPSANVYITPCWVSLIFFFSFSADYDNAIIHNPSLC